MTEVRHEPPQDSNANPKLQHSGDLGLEQPFLDEKGKPAFGTGPIKEENLGDLAGILARLTPEQREEFEKTAGIVFGDPERMLVKNRFGHVVKWFLARLAPQLPY